jgi:hypothetical protein
MSKSAAQTSEYDRNRRADHGCHMRVLLVKAMKNVDAQGAVQDRLTQSPQSIYHMLHLIAIVSDRETPLNKGLNFGIKNDDTSFFVADELLFKPKPNGARRQGGSRDNFNEVGHHYAKKAMI